MREISSYALIMLSFFAADITTHHVDFKQWKDLPYTTNMVAIDFSGILSNTKMIQVEHPENVSIKDSLLTFNMPKDKVWVEGSGAQFVIPTDPRQSVTLEYEVYFDGNGSPYDWTSGGKLPGFAGGKGYTGGSPATAGDGFSVRLMFGEGGQLFAYVYHVDMKGSYGEPLGIVANNILKQYTWNKITIKCQINTHEDYNGRLEVWANDEYVGEKNSIRFCTKGCQIDKILLVSYHGGQTPDYKPTQDQSVKFKWFRISY